MLNKLSNKQSFALAALRVAACAKGKSPQQNRNDILTQLKFNYNTLTVVRGTVQHNCVKHGNLRLRLSVSCGCAETELKPKMMMTVRLRPYQIFFYCGMGQCTCLFYYFVLKFSVANFIETPKLQDQYRESETATFVTELETRD